MKATNEAFYGMNREVNLNCLAREMAMGYQCV